MDISSLVSFKPSLHYFSVFIFCFIWAVRNRAPDEFSPFIEKPGDFHTEGKLSLSFGKMLGQGEFYYFVRQLLSRQQVTSKCFLNIVKRKVNKTKTLEQYVDFVGLDYLVEEIYCYSECHAPFEAIIRQLSKIMDTYEDIQNLKILKNA